MRRVGIALALLVGTLGVVTAGEREHRREHKHIAILDDCDPRDPNWASVGGCTLEEGDVTSRPASLCGSHRSASS